MILERIQFVLVKSWDLIDNCQNHNKKHIVLIMIKAVFYRKNLLKSYTTYWKYNDFFCQCDVYEMKKYTAAHERVIYCMAGVSEGMKKWWVTSLNPTSKTDVALCYQTTKKWLGTCPKALPLVTPLYVINVSWLTPFWSKILSTLSDVSQWA